jgi:hypothetical protein
LLEQIAILNEELEELEDRRSRRETEAKTGWTPLFQKIDTIRGPPEMPPVVTAENTLLLPEFLIEKWMEQESLAPKDAEEGSHDLKERLRREILAQDFRARLSFALQKLGPAASDENRLQVVRDIEANHPIREIARPLVASVPPQSARTSEEEARKIASRIVRDYHKFGSSLDGLLILTPYAEQTDLIVQTVAGALKDREALKASLRAQIEEQKRKKADKEKSVPGGKIGEDPRPKLKGAAKGAYTRLLNTIQSLEEAAERP